MRNIELFNIYTGKVFAYFYGHFPIAKGIVFADIVEEMRPATGLAAPTGDPEWRTHLETCSQTVMWLQDTDYLIRRGEDPARFVLAPKALEALNAKLEPLHPKQTLGEQLTEATQMIGGDVRSSAIGELVKLVIGAAIRLA